MTAVTGAKPRVLPAVHAETVAVRAELDEWLTRVCEAADALRAEINRHTPPDGIAGQEVDDDAGP